MTIEKLLTETAIGVRRRRSPMTGLALRMLIALVISWIIIMAFFLTSAH